MKESIALLYDEINGLLQNNSPFVVYRLPYGNELHILLPGSVGFYDSIDKLDVRKGFIMAPFSCGDGGSKIAVLAFGDERTYPFCKACISVLPESDTVLEKCISDSENDFLGYSDVFGRFKEALSAGQFKKLVLARSKHFKPVVRERLVAAFFRAAAEYDSSFVYMCNTAETGLWFGATPEILLESCDGKMHTVALAGTKPVSEWNESPVWDDKNIEEQGYVASYIRSVLEGFDNEYSDGQTYTVMAGKVVHLKTDFRFRLNDHGLLNSLISGLHPTPAVCGLPKEKALDFILKTENLDRKYYSGFVGPFNGNDNFGLYVNIRCLNADSSGLTFFAGGGILPGSDVETEFRETENKMQTLLDIF